MSDASFKDFVLDQLRPMPGLRCRAMFGGAGLYADGTFFGILYRGRLYFKTNETTRAEYRRHGMSPFRPSAKQTLKSYYEVPVDILENQDELTAWAERAVGAAHAAG